MRRRKMLAIAGAGLAVVVGVGLAALPSMIEARLAGFIDAAAESLVDVDVELGAVDVSVYKTFPRVELELTDLVVAGRGPFEGIDLARLPRVGLGMDLFSALSGGALTIEEVSADGGTVRVVYLEDGRPNWDVLPPDDGGDPAEDYRLHLDRVALHDLDIVYEDRASDLRTDISDVDVEASADLTQNLARVESAGTVDSLTMRYGGVTWLEATRWKSDMLVDYDQQTGAITFGENTVTVNALPLEFSGKAVPIDDAWDLDLAFRSTDTSFASLLSLVPSAYGEQFSSVDASGTVRFEGTTEGRYQSESDDLPGYHLEVSVTDGRFQFPGAPTAVEGVSAQVVLDHPQGPADLTRVRADHFEVRTSGAGFRGRLSLATPISDPDLDLMLDGTMDLGALASALPTDAGPSGMDGVLDLDFAVKGRMSAFERGQVESVKAEGTVRGRDLRGRYEGELIEVDRLDLELDPRLFRLNELAMRMAGSDMRWSGTLENLVPWLMTEDAVLGGKLELGAQRLNLRPFQEDEEAADPGSPDDAGDEALLVAVPDRVDVALDMTVSEIDTRDFRMNRVRGRVAVADQAIRMEGLSARMVGGEVVLNGRYHAPTAETADLDLTVRGRELILGDTLRTFETLALIAPVLQRANGTFNGDFSLTTKLGRDGSPDLSLISSAGGLVPQNMTLRSQTTDALLGKLGGNAEALALAGVAIFYAFQEGKVDLEPFATKIGPQDATIGGSFGPLDRKLALQVDVPIQTAVLQGSPLLAPLGADLPRTLDARVVIEGTYDKPTLKLKLKDGEVEELVDAALDPLVAAAMEEGDKLLAEAQASAEALLDAAENEAEQLLEAARKEARRIKREARGKPLQEAAAALAAKAIREEGDDAVRKVRRMADKKADALIAEAREKRQDLIREARAKAEAAAGGDRR